MADLEFNILKLLDPVFWLTLLLVIIGLVLLWFGLRALYKKFAERVKYASAEKKSLNAAIFEIRVPKNNEVESQAADQMFSSLLSIGAGDKSNNFKDVFKAKSFVSFEIVSLPGSIRFFVVASKNVANTVEKAINGSYPSAEVIISKEYNIFSDGSSVEYAALKLESDAFKPIRAYDELSTDTMATILSPMSKLGPNEAIAYQVLISQSSGGWRNKGKSYVQKIRAAFSDPEKKDKPKVNDDVLASIERKCEKGGFDVDIRFVAVAPDKDNAKAYVDTMASIFSQFKKEGGNGFKKLKLKPNEKMDILKKFINRVPDETMTLNTGELATVMHFPNNKVDVPNINWLMAKRAPVSGEIPSTGDLWLGMNIFRDVQRHVYIDRDDRRRHMYLIGKTGAGKSWFMQQMAYQDMVNGEGLAFLDPHGDSAEWLIERIPAHRLEDVIYWNPGDVERPIGFNIIEFYNEQDKHRVVNAFLGLMTKMYDPHNQGITGPRFERAVRNSMLTVMENSGATLIEVLRILSDPVYQQKLIPLIKDDLVKRYWTDEMANTQEFHKSEVLGYIVSKFDRFVTNKLTRNIFGQSKSGFDMRWLMDNKKILIVNLSKGLIGEENAQFLGLLLVPRILSAAMSRADIPERDRKDFYLYVDEFQNFSTEDFAQILSEARKYKLNLIVGNQYISQIDEKIRNAVFGNVGTTLSMKVGTTDAQFLETLFTPVFNASDLVNLENRNAYVKIINKGESPPAFSISTDYNNAPFKLPMDGDPKIAEIVKNLSRFRYGRDRAMVEAEIRERGMMGESVSAKPALNSPYGSGGWGGAAPLAPGK